MLNGLLAEVFRRTDHADLRPLERAGIHAIFTEADRGQ